MTDFPTIIPSFTDLNPSTTLAANNHGARHNKVHAEVDAIATKVGITSSADNTSIDYKLQNVTTGNKAETAANKSTDGTFGSNSDTLYPSQKASKTYVDTQIAIPHNASTVNSLSASATGSASSLLFAETMGWIALPITLTYSSNPDTTTFIVSTSADVSAFVGLGDKIWLTHSSTSKYFIVTAISASTITLFGGTDYTLAATAITLPYFSKRHTPQGFNKSPEKWTIEFTSGTQINTGVIASAATITYLSPCSILVPIGSWDLEFVAYGQITVASATAFLGQVLGLSDANNTLAISDLVAIGPVLSSSAAESDQMFTKHKKITLTASKTYYLNTKSAGVTNTTQYVNGSGAPITIRAVSNYI